MLLMLEDRPAHRGGENKPNFPSGREVVNKEGVEGLALPKVCEGLF
jgi:hypothetical protein